MFVRLLVCVGLLTLLCFGLVGCGDEDPVSVSEVARLVQTVPASGERAAAHQPVVLYFDKTPLAVTVTGLRLALQGMARFGLFQSRLRMEIGYFILNGQTLTVPRMLVHL